MVDAGEPVTTWPHTTIPTFTLSDMQSRLAGRATFFLNAFSLRAPTRAQQKNGGHEEIHFIFEMNCGKMRRNSGAVHFT